ncbi:hypothetical protein AUEXF2481DRAFT_28993 [Aureobasidium subglaciale EXF-2481]|uniref:Uncharacterized protein n=1 Tax=Aureobasidium subglaciale (strain EXF-2481) TaxID=1043005 RepID=A0A074YN80_AURSE|nr:uncharacterized protein AUEXF2481DRAFT_28993 [Aureobasidium subglaciale EXF-2481]KEQ95557.1 hypothetical protein AUEXF2481DRAFT_28993 [Aureobasidium subglaciale EXF-2481]
MSVQIQLPVDSQHDVDSQQSIDDASVLEGRQPVEDQQPVGEEESTESQPSADENDSELEHFPEDEATRPIRLPGVSTQVVSISPEALWLFREAARDYGYMNRFFCEADEAFTDAMIDTYGTSRVPIPLLIPLSGDDYIAFYAMILRTHQVSNPCWLSYHEGFKSIMQRVARDLDIPTELPIVYMRLRSALLYG